MDWLLGIDPAIRWQVRRDLLDEPESAWAADRAAVETQGWGARLLALQDADGQWAGGSFVPAGFTRELWQAEGQPWTATAYALDDLRALGLDPDSESASRTVRLVGEHSRWDHDDEPFWEGEVEECINGRTVASGAYFGVDMTALVKRLLGEQQSDGGWNCERATGSVRSSFDTTINVLEGLLAFQRWLRTTTDSGLDERVRAARVAGQEYLLERGLFRRLSTGAPADSDYLQLAYPQRWRYDVLRALDHLRAADLDAGDHGGGADPRISAALDIVAAKPRPDGRWAVERRPEGQVWFDYDDGVGTPSPWLTLLALRVLRWAGRD